MWPLKGLCLLLVVVITVYAIRINAERRSNDLDHDLLRQLLERMDEKDEVLNMLKKEWTKRHGNSWITTNS
ncbi:hypothetical protein DPMN_063873 [Dreissena polymorpha]|uniref:Uncharacterized protein n=1 Tax=Dreissena polymorpha TaxID=45954 RepID=A0A9D4CCB5_DREPO|nr:hypothetical protein DPMN_063873 [Dreissena polymorpha]